MSRKHTVAEWKADFPDYVDKINQLKLEDGAFVDRSLPCHFYLPDELEEIGNNAFTEANITSDIDIQSFNLPSALKKLGKAVFADAQFDGYFDLVVPRGVSEIPESCFSEIEFSGTFSFNEGLEVIRDDAFAYSRLELDEPLNLPQSLKKVEPGAFAGTKYVYKGTEYMVPNTTNVEFLRKWFIKPE